MENQHRKISGYRELSEEEVDLMNRIKAKGQELLDLQAELERDLKARDEYLEKTYGEYAPYRPNFDVAESLRWVAIGKTDIQTGVMALVRAVAQPTTC